MNKLLLWRFLYTEIIGLRNNKIKEGESSVCCAKLELDHLSLSLLLTSQLEMLSSLDGNLVLPVAGNALQPEHQLLSGLSLTPQDRLGLTTETLLLTIVSSPTLSSLTFSRLLVLCNLELAVFVTLGAVGVPCLGNIHHFYLL